MSWRRPVQVRPQVWLSFQGRSRDGARPQMFQVRDIRPEDKKACIQLMLHSFLEDEPLCKALDLKSDPESIETVRRDWEAMMEQDISIACYAGESGTDDGGELVGFNLLVVKEKGAEETLYGVKGEAWCKLLKTLETAEGLVDVYDHYGVDAYLSCSGLTVKPEYRGQNIGGRLLEARKPICKALGLTVTASIYTAGASQTLAARSGHELLATLRYQHMQQRGVLLTHPVIQDNPTAEVRGTKFQFHDQRRLI